MLTPLPLDPSQDDPPPGAPARRRVGDAEDRPKVADALIEIRALRMGLRDLDRHRAELDGWRMKLEERLDGAEMRLVEVVRRLELRHAA